MEKLHRQFKNAGTPEDTSEWDFRQIGEAELLTATLVEYTRSSRQDVAAIKDWQATPFDHNRCIESGNAFTSETLSMIPRPRTCAEAIDLMFGDKAVIDNPDLKSHLLDCLQSAAAVALGPRIDRTIAARFTALDLSWYAMRETFKSQNLKLPLVPPASSRRCVKGNLGPRSTYAQYLKDPQIKVEKMLIDWTAPVGAIERSFGIWARGQKAKIASFSHKIENSRVKWDLLKFLAAYRLHVRDSNFDHFKKTVADRMEATRKLGNLPIVMPLYRTHKGWLGAVAKANILLSSDYPRLIRQSFGFPAFEFDDQSYPQ